MRPHCLASPFRSFELGRLGVHLLADDEHAMAVRIGKARLSVGPHAGCEPHSLRQFLRTRSVLGSTSIRLELAARLLRRGKPGIAVDDAGGDRHLHADAVT
jgi:hypothetical protein